MAASAACVSGPFVRLRQDLVTVHYQGVCGRIVHNMSNLQPDRIVPSPPPSLPPAQNLIVRERPGRFEFDGGAGSYFGVSIAAALVTVLTLGFGAPWGMCMRYRWRTEHTIIDGRRLRFTGSAGSLFGHWLKWWLLCIVTVGIYGFWMTPRLAHWVTTHQTFA